MKEKDYEQQLLEWRFHQVQFRRKYRNTPAGFQNRQEEITVINAWKEDVKRFRKGRMKKIQSLYQPESQPFVGREQELLRIEHTLKEENGTAIVYGIGGIGKTALVQEYLCRHQEHYDGILYLNFSKSIKNTVCSDIMLSISNLKFNPEKYENLTKYYKVKMQILQEIMTKGNYILILDDCNIEMDHNLEDFLGLPGDKIITTRVNPDAWGYSGIEIRPFQEKKEWDEFAALYTKEPLSEEGKRNFLEYVKTIHGHTLAAMLKISSRNMGYDTEEVGKELLQRFPLKKREKEILMYLSIMPTEGIEYSVFEIMAQLKEGELKRLQEFLLIQISRAPFEKGNGVSLHPLIAEAVRTEYPANPINYRSFLRGLEKYLKGENPQKKDLWENSYENNRNVEEYVFSVVNTFSEPVPWMAETFDRLSTFLWVQGYFEKAEEYSLKIYKSVENYYGESHQLTGWMAIRMGAVYYNKMERQRANVWYLKGLEILKKCKPINQEYYVYLMEALAIAARMYRHKGDYTQALEHIEQAMECFYTFKKQLDMKRHPMKDDQSLKLPYYLISKTGILMDMGRLTEAEQLYPEALRAFESVSSDEFRKNTFRNVRVEMLMRNEEYEKAEKLAEENLKYSYLYRGESYKDTLIYMEKLADIQRCLGKETEAAGLYQNVLLCLRRDYPNQEQWIEKISLKLNC